MGGRQGPSRNHRGRYRDVEGRGGVGRPHGPIGGGPRRPGEDRSPGAGVDAEAREQLRGAVGRLHRAGRVVGRRPRDGVSECAIGRLRRVREARGWRRPDAGADRSVAALRRAQGPGALGRHRMGWAPPGGWRHRRRLELAIGGLEVTGGWSRRREPPPGAVCRRSPRNPDAVGPGRLVCRGSRRGGLARWPARAPDDVDRRLRCRTTWPLVGHWHREAALFPYLIGQHLSRCTSPRLQST